MHTGIGDFPELRASLHRNEDEIASVLPGEPWFALGEERFAAGADACMFLLRGVQHGYTVTTAAAQLLTTLFPAGLEAFFQEAQEQLDQTDLELLIGLEGRFGLEITGTLRGANGQLTLSEVDAGNAG